MPKTRSCFRVAGFFLVITAGHSNGAPTLKDAFAGHFLIGTALSESQFTEKDSAQAALVKDQFNAISPENVLKWDTTEPQQGKFNFGPGDEYVAFGEKNGMFIVGHTLVWHSQTPKWVFEDGTGKPVDRDTLLARMHDHIMAVVGRYKGRIKSWDVVNEVVGDDGKLRQSPWLEIIGEDYINKAFEFAHEADPDAELFYNDYSLDNPQKRKGAIELVQRLRSAGVPITGVGSQEHINLDWPSPKAIDETITDFGNLGVKVAITEVDVDVLPSRSGNHSADIEKTEAADSALNPYTAGLPDSVEQKLAAKYAALFAIYLKHPGLLSRVTLWGVTDGDSWLNNFPIHGRTNYPLLFDRQCQPKPAYAAVLHTASPSSTSSVPTSSP